ncbi:long-chain-fatty-acid--CoA ligase [Nocardia higoensis]|uniref:long-chain-fatty-acid--CoA ligase n=1 Tax=Nocardia higoensis TaxID=228599 RepID=UPI00030AC865|nr:long-chain-fatty-acid--CoA ligase [Nocardia higoensis]
MNENISAALNRAVALFGDRDAMVDGDIRWTYRDLDRYVGAFDAALDDFGLDQGDVVGVLAKNSRAHLVAWLGVPRSGRVLNEINTRLSPAEVEFILDDSAARVLIIDEDFLDMGRSLRDTVPTLGTLVYAGTGECPADCTSFEEIVSSGRAAPQARVAGEAVAGIFYTGGTTGRAKGVLLTHDNLVANAKHALLCLGYTEHDSYLHSGPMFHLADGASTIALTWVGGKHVILPGFERRSWLEAVAKERITRAMLVPTMITMLLAEPIPADLDISSLRSVLYGASPTPQAVLRDAMEALGCDWCQVYGMTEAAPIVTFLSHEDHRLGVSGDDPEASARLRSAGRPVVGVEVEIRSETGELVDTGMVGEIVVRGSNIMKGYLNRPEETEQVLIDGWYRTGDMGYLDQGGYLYVVDRLKDMIISGGENVYSTEVENALYRHPDVLEVAVFGAPDSQWGEAVHAAVVLRGSSTTTAEALRTHTRELIAGFKVPRVVHLLDGALPKSGAGKILKRNLREQFAPVDL